MSANDFLMFLYIFNIVTFSDTFCYQCPPLVVAHMTTGQEEVNIQSSGHLQFYMYCSVAHSHREFIVQVSSCQTNVNLELFVFKFPCSVFRILQKRPTVPYVMGLIGLMTGNNNEAVLHKPQSSKPLSSSLIVILCHSL